MVCYVGPIFLYAAQKITNADIVTFYHSLLSTSKGKKEVLGEHRKVIKIE